MGWLPLRRLVRQIGLDVDQAPPGRTHGREVHPARGAREPAATGEPRTTASVSTAQAATAATAANGDARLKSRQGGERGADSAGRAGRSSPGGSQPLPPAAQPALHAGQAHPGSNGQERHGTPGRAPARLTPLHTPLPRTERAERALLAILAALAALGTTGCVTPVKVTPLATGRTDAAAYRLFGTDLPELKTQADRMCPGGYQVWHASQRGTPLDGSTLAMWQRVIRQSDGSAQILIVCRQNPSEMLWAAERARNPEPPARAASDAAAAQPASTVAGNAHGQEAHAAVKPEGPAHGKPQGGRGQPSTAPVTGYDR